MFPGQGGPPLVYGQESVTCDPGWTGPHVMVPNMEVENAKGNPFVCNLCRKTYGRIDHLARHFRSHTNEKPFRCQECGKGFARVDLLRRHANLHAGDDRATKKRRIRASRACEGCATVKVKCDQEKPCRRCKANGMECRVEPNTQWPGINENESDEQNGHRMDSEMASPIYNQTQSIAPSNDSQKQSMPPPMPPTAPHEATETAVTLTDELSLTDFLRDILQPGPLPEDGGILHRPGSAWNNTHGMFTPRNLMDIGQDLSMDFHDFDGALLDGWDAWLDPSLANMPLDKPSEPTSVSDISTPSIDESIGMGSAAFRRSAWQWTPNHEKGNQHEVHLTSCAEDGHTKEQAPPTHPHCLKYPVDHKARDKVVAMLLTVCDKSNYQRIVGFFPAASILDTFVSNFLVSVESSLDDWIHIPSLRPNECIPEFLALMIAGGAVASQSSRASKLGYALQETSRLAIPALFERDNSNTRSLQALQAYAICLDIGVWSGNKRTMELAESQTLPLITMLRRSGRFRRPHTIQDPPTLEDSSEVLEKKWRQWIEAESFKRAAYHVFLHSAQVSIAFRTPPLISYAEITLELPAPTELWRARTAAQWRDHYLAMGGDFHTPSFLQNLYDAQGIGLIRYKIALELTLYLVLLAHWCLIWEYIQLNSADKAQLSPDLNWTGSLLASSQRQELRRLMENFQVEIDSWGIPVPKELQLAAELLRMNLCVGFEDLQNLAGKEGEEEARRALPTLKKWFNSPESRQALWHAGQIVRAARLPDERESKAQVRELWLRDFFAVALYHAGLAFWVYGLLSHAIAPEQQDESFADPTGNHQLPVMGQNGVMGSGNQIGEIFHVDADARVVSAGARHRFISLGKGIPVITGEQGQPDDISLTSSKQIMDAIMMIMMASCSLKSKGKVQRILQRPAMVENLIQLMYDLGEAASEV